MKNFERFSKSVKKVIGNFGG